MIQNMILPQIGLAQEQNAIQGAFCALVTPYSGPIVVGSHDPKYDTTTDWLGQEKNTNHATQGPTVFWKRHTRSRLCSDPMIQILYYLRLARPKNKLKSEKTIQGTHCVLESPYRALIVFGSHDQKTAEHMIWHHAAHSLV